MGKIAKGKTLLGLTVPNAWRDEIDRRADALNLTRSTYAALVIEDWYKRGCPPITEPDRLMQIAKGRRQT